MIGVPARRFTRGGPETRETLLFAALVAVSGTVPLSLPALDVPDSLVLAGLLAPVLAVGGVLLVSYCLVHMAIPLARRGASVGECWVFLGLPAFAGLTVHAVLYAPGLRPGRAVGGALGAAGVLALVFGTAGWAVGRRSRTA